MQFFQSTKRNKIIGYGLLVFFVFGMILLAIFISTFIGLENHKDQMVQQAYEIAKEETPLVNLKTSYIYNGEQAYIVLTGQDEQENELHVFIPKPDESQGEISWIEASEGVSRTEMIDSWQSSCEQCKLMDVNLGILNNQYVWEVIYHDQQRMYFQTYRFSNGELYDSISFNH